MLNMSYMLVQMMYGVWTNSLGLISDGTFWKMLNSWLTVDRSYPHGIRLHGHWSRPIRIRNGYLGT